MNKISVMCTVRFKNFSVMKNIIKQISLYFYKTKSILLKYHINTSKQYRDQFVLIKLKKKNVVTKAQSMGNVGKLRKSATPTLMYIYTGMKVCILEQNIYTWKLIDAFLSNPR